MWIARMMELPEVFPLQIGNGATFPIVWSIAGSALFVGILGLLGRRGKV
jgi:hypothetical protein